MKRLELQNSIIQMGEKLVNEKLAWGTSGNISVRKEEDEMIITGSSTELGNLTYTDLVEVDLKTGESKGEKRPSKEVPMHSAIYQSRKDANVILHSSPFWATVIASSNLELTSNLFIEAMHYLANVSSVEYFHPGSDELGVEVGLKSINSNVIIMKNHGVIVFDKSFPEAKMRLETVEFTSKMIVLANIKDLRLTHLNECIVSEFHSQSVYKKKL